MDKIVSQNIKRILELVNMPRKELAEKLGYSYSYFTNMLNGYNKISSPILDKIIFILGVNEDDIIIGFSEERAKEISNMRYEKLLNELLHETDLASHTVSYERLLSEIHNINQNIENLRKANRLPMTKFLDLLDISTAQMKYYQKSLFPVEIIKRITVVFEISVEDLITGKTSNEPSDTLLEELIQKLPARKYMLAFQNKVNVSYAELARRINIEEETLYNYIYTNRITLSLLKQIATSFGTYVEYILFSATNLYKNISIFRILNGYSTNELEKLSNVSYSIFSHSYLSKYVPDICSLKMLADALNISLYQMITGVPDDLANLILDKEKFLDKFSKNLKLYLQLHNISQKELVYGTFLAPKTISHMVNGKNFYIHNARLVVEYINTSIVDILLLK